MAEIITLKRIELPERELTGITEQNFWDYLIWEANKSELKRRILKGFKDKAALRTGYNNRNLPESATPTIMPIGDEIILSVTSTPTTKRPSYSVVNEEFSYYIDFLLHQHANGIKRRGIITHDGKAYASVDYLIDELRNSIDKLTEGKEDVSYSLELVEPEELVSRVPKHLQISLDRDYSALTDYNTRMYFVTDNFIDSGNKRISPFKDMLLNDSLQVLGEAPKRPRNVSYPFENTTFIHQLEPRETPSYKSIIDSLMKKPPKKINKKSKIGDLEKIRMTKDSDLNVLLRDQKLIDDDFFADYNPITRRDKFYVNLEGLKKRFYQHRRDNLSPSIEQNILIRPANYL